MGEGPLIPGGMRGGVCGMIGRLRFGLAVAGTGVALARMRVERRRGVVGSEGGGEERLELPKEIVVFSREIFESGPSANRFGAR